MSSALLPRVLHIVPAPFDPEDGILGGAERFAFELARHMADETPTTLLTFGRRDRRERVGGLHVHVASSVWYVRGQRTNPVSAALFAELRRADVVHCHQQHVLASSIAALVCRVSRRRVFVTDLGGGGWDLSAYVSTDGWYHGHLHLSEYSREISRHTGRRTAHVIYGGVDTDKFSPGSGESAGPVLFVGRLLPHKGVDYLIRALPSDMPLEIVGRPLDAEYTEHLRQLAAGKQVSFRHDCDDAALVRSYRAARCVVLPSVYKASSGGETIVPELLGQTLLEGMACGRPAVCTNVASMPEIVQNDVTGFVVPPNDPDALARCLVSLRDEPHRARTMGRAGRELVLKRFTWPSVAKRCLEIYRNERQLTARH